MNLNEYLKRIDFAGTPKADYETLYKLQTLHLQSIPYENLDIIKTPKGQVRHLYKIQTLIFMI